MNRQDALKAAEELVSRLAPATNTRGYLEGTAPLNVRVAEILRVAEFLQQDGEKDAPTTKYPQMFVDGSGDTWVLHSADDGTYTCGNSASETLTYIRDTYGIPNEGVSW